MKRIRNSIRRWQIRQSSSLLSDCLNYRLLCQDRIPFFANLLFSLMLENAWWGISLIELCFVSFFFELHAPRKFEFHLNWEGDTDFTRNWKLQSMRRNWFLPPLPSHHYPTPPPRPQHYGAEQPGFETFTFPRARECESEQASKRMGESEHASEASRAEQASEWAVRANKQTDKRVAKYLCPDFWLF